MPSQLELLKEKVPKLDAEFGAENPYVLGLKAQIAKLEKPTADNPSQTHGAGMRPSPLLKVK